MRIFIEGLEFLAAHGVYEQERREGRRFRVDLSVELTENQGCESDEL
ncbi:MAG: dihydroneopterin aldolase, partial [Myxococcota bacterium]|nr:dihydroneopterin aldolase [Myxococcota bacterium]